MYEHAYHMDFGAKAAAYVDASMKNIEWDRVYRRYGAAVAGDAVAWSAKPSEAAGAPQLIDVRRVETYADAGDRIAGASWRDPSQLDTWSRELDPARPVLAYCVHGLDIGRSAALALRARGFDARYVEGGIEACRAAGVPLTAKSVEP